MTQKMMGMSKNQDKDFIQVTSMPIISFAMLPKPEILLDGMPSSYKPRQ